MHDGREKEREEREEREEMSLQNKLLLLLVPVAGCVDNQARLHPRKLLCQAKAAELFVVLVLRKLLQLLISPHSNDRALQWIGVA